MKHWKLILGLALPITIILVWRVGLHELGSRQMIYIISDMVLYFLIMAPASIVIILLCESRSHDPESRNSYLLVCPLLILLLVGLLIGMIIPCVNPVPYESQIILPTLLSFSGYSWLKLARKGTGFRRYLAVFFLYCYGLLGAWITVDFLKCLESG